MDPRTRSLIAVAFAATVSVNFSITPGSAPIMVTLVDAGAPGANDGALPSAAFARVQKMNSSGSFNDFAFIGSGRNLAIELTSVGTYRVMKGDSTPGTAFGVDITSADFGLAPPGDPGPGDVARLSSLQTGASDVSPPFPSAYTKRTTLMENGQAIDVTAGISVSRITSPALAPQGFDPPFPQPMPETVSRTFDLMYQGVAFAVTVGLQLAFPPPVGNVDI